jgi:hypothetical protein
VDGNPALMPAMNLGIKIRSPVAAPCGVRNLHNEPMGNYLSDLGSRGKFRSPMFGFYFRGISGTISAPGSSRHAHPSVGQLSLVAEDNKVAMAASYQCDAVSKWSFQ